jgi:hypothetical protein
MRSFYFHPFHGKGIGKPPQSKARKLGTFTGVDLEPYRENGKEVTEEVK